MSLTIGRNSLKRFKSSLTEYVQSRANEDTLMQNGLDNSMDDESVLESLALLN